MPSTCYSKCQSRIKSFQDPNEHSFKPKNLVKNQPINIRITSKTLTDKKQKRLTTFQQQSHISISPSKQKKRDQIQRDQQQSLINKQNSLIMQKKEQQKWYKKKKTSHHRTKRQKYEQTEQIEMIFASVQPLPRPWQMIMSSNGSFYYYNPETMKIQQSRPSY
ncbi:uncharacterized protein BX664DRAFT_337622 [Halteromyces radiatus]|uniref:uncharacterized protein n=1 Tax=Halteromyces radiatus TaxID=101107 RepID=UPI00222050A9|nr:uncharacterized protein BX664DRAFT_337622 [Halteromyces radiatus]KAI8084723.1 hypothetical protein BX664DRAFT_337622 [Halteromyces radiatus]